MTRSPFGALSLLLALASGSIAVAMQEAPTHSSDRRVKDLLRRIDKRTDTFRSSFDRAIDRNPINGTREEDQINGSVKDFERSTDRLRDRVNDSESGAADVEEVLGRASLIDNFMTRNQLDAAAEDDWKDLRQDLEQLAYVYGVTWNWTRFGNMPDRVDDEQLEQLLQRIAKGAHQFRRSLDKALDENPRDRWTAEDDIDQFVAEFAETTNHVTAHFSRNEVVTDDIEDILRRGASIDRFMERHRLNEQAQDDWLRLRRDLEDLARAYNLTWSWSDLPLHAGRCRYGALSSPDPNRSGATRPTIASVPRQLAVWDRRARNRETRLRTEVRLLLRRGETPASGRALAVEILDTNSSQLPEPNGTFARRSVGSSGNHSLCLRIEATTWAGAAERPSPATRADIRHSRRYN